MLNHAIRKHYGNENAIIQTSSHVKDKTLRLEFKFFENLKKPSIQDMPGIESICAQLIKDSLNIYVTDDVDLNEDNVVFNYPLRKLKDVLYPSKVRVVSIGTDWKNFVADKRTTNADYSAELCCGNF